MNFPVPSPSQNMDKHRMTPGGSVAPPPSSSADPAKFPAPSPGHSGGPRTPMDPSASNNRFPVPSPGHMGSGPPGGRFPGPPGPGGMSPMQHDAPLNPSAPGTMSKGFDPISSMAQMSQQLTNSPVPTSSANSGGPPDLCNMDAGMMSMGR